MKHTRRNITAVAAIIVATAASASASLLPFGASAQAAPKSSSAAIANARVTVNANRRLGAITNTSIGINTAIWDPYLLAGNLPHLLQQVGVTVLRFPGGSDADIYHWQQNTLTPGAAGYVDPSDTFDAFMGVVHKVGGQALITVNYGSNATGTGGGSPAEAAAWVKYANVTQKDNIQYWEIGNEVYGNGTYGANWEEDLHRQKGPAAYARNALAFIKAMKTVDPHIKIGVVLTIPGVWPNGKTPHWNRTVLSIVKSHINFVIIHWYPQNPGQESDAGLLHATSAIPTMMARLRSEIAHYCGPHAKNIQVLLTETNSVSFNPGKQTVSLVNALFLADDYMTWLQNGVANVDWWAVHNGAVTGTNNSKSLYGNKSYGDYGILSSATTSGGVSEPPAETPFPAYYGMQMVHILAQPGDQMIQASSTQPLVAVHAVIQKGGRLAVMFINKSPTTTYRVTLPLPPQQQHSKTVAVYRYGEASKAIAFHQETVHTKQLALSLSPYSITTVILAK